AIIDYIVSKSRTIDIPATKVKEVMKLRDAEDVFYKLNGSRPSDSYLMKKLDLSEERLKGIRTTEANMKQYYMSTPLDREERQNSRSVNGSSNGNGNGIGIGDRIEGDWRDNPEKRFLQKEMMQLFKSALSSLDGGGDLLTKLYFEGMSPEEVAEEKGITSGEVDQIVRRAQQILQKKIGREVRDYIQDLQ
ncbi:RNA polymerase sigma factor, partial [Candidatus Altiarchaeota archaeon]